MMRRHNGLPSSCEPCRISKLRCDHNVPTCGRCRRKGKAASCVYRLKPTQARPSIAGTAQTPLAPRDQYIKDWSRQLALNSTPSFLGLTSFSAVYSENKASLKQHSSITPLPDLSPPRVQDGVYVVDDFQAQLGAELLSLLFDDFELCRRMAIIGEDSSTESTIYLPTIRTICDLVEGMYRSVSSHLDRQSRLLALSRRLFEGTARDLVTHAAMTFDEYLIAFSGRWEAVGFIITMFGICAAHTTVDDPLFNALGLSAADHKNLGILATAGSDRCLQFCDSMGVMGDAVGWLLLQHINLLTLVCGDYDYRPRKRLGELSTLLFAMGYHQLDTGDDLPFFLAEGRKRLMVSAYTCDKALATFLGCPPLIAYRFCRIQPPLDLAPAELIAEPVVRDAAIRKLDSQGWNTKGFIKGSSWSRISLRLAHVRELVLELSLDSHYQNIWKRAEDISRLFSQVRSELPSFLRWDEKTESALRLTNTFPIYIHLDLLYSNFLLQRILVKHSLTGSETLISLAHQILTATLTQIAIGQRCNNPFSELGWLIPYFGLPSAGILAIELLRMTQNPQLRLNETPFPRSEVIQNLSILVSHIQYIILPQKGNYEICQQGRKVISYILEYVLDQPPTDVTVSVPPVVPNNLIPSDWLADEWLNDGTDFIKWIDGLDWDEDNEL